MKKAVLTITLLLAFACFYQACVGQSAIDITDSMLVCRSKMDPAHFVLTPSGSLFYPASGRHFDFGLTGDEFCYLLLHISVHSKSGSYRLSIDNTSLDTVLIYRLRPAHSPVLLYQGGNLIPYQHGRLYVWHTAPLLLTHEPQLYLVAVKAAAKNVHVSYKIWEEGSLQLQYRSFDRLIYFYLGLMSVIISICLIGIVLFKNKNIGLYVTYVLAVTGWVLAHYGYLYSAFYPALPAVNNIAKAVCCLVAANSFIHLVWSLFHQDLRPARFYRLYRAIVWINRIFFLFSVLYLLVPFPVHLALAYNIGWNTAVLLSICLVVGTLLKLYRENRTARIFLGAIGVLSIMALLQLVALLGKMHNYFLNDHGILIGSCLEMLMLTAGVFYNIWEDKIFTGRRLQVLEQKQKDALRMLIRAQENERKHIAEDLHDSIGPMLAAIRINFLRIIGARPDQTDRAALIAKTERIMDESISEIRNISHQLMPKNLVSKGLITLLTEYFEHVQAGFGITLHFTHSIKSPLQEEMQLNIYRVICELVLNAAKHSHAHKIDVLLEVSPSGLEAVVHDDGKGFDPAAGKEDSFGIKNVESRISYHKGSLDITSGPVQGTLVRITIPFP